MPIARFQMPDGRIARFEVPEGTTPEEAQQLMEQAVASGAAQQTPDTSKSGFLPAVKAGWENLKGDIAGLAGRSGLMSIKDAEAQQARNKAAAEKAFTPTKDSWLDSPWLKLKETAGGSLPYMAAPAAAGMAGAVAGPVAAMGAAGLTSAAQFTGSNLSRQQDEGKPLADTDLQSAALAAVPQAALDMVGFKMIPGIRQIFAAAGKELTPKAAAEIAKSGLKATLADYAKAGVKATGTEGITEAAQQVFERLQAGLALTDEAAREEYLQNFIGGAALGGALAIPGRFRERGHERAQAARIEEAKQLKAEQDAAALQQQQEAQRQAQLQDPAYAQQVTDRYNQLYAQHQAMLPGKLGAAATGADKLENEAQQAAADKFYEENVKPLEADAAAVRPTLKAMQDQAFQAAQEKAQATTVSDSGETYDAGPGAVQQMTADRDVAYQQQAAAVKMAQDAAKKGDMAGAKAAQEQAALHLQRAKALDKQLAGRQVASATTTVPPDNQQQIDRLTKQYGVAVQSGKMGQAEALRVQLEKLHAAQRERSRLLEVPPSTQVSQVQDEEGQAQVEPPAQAKPAAPVQTGWRPRETPILDASINMRAQPQGDNGPREKYRKPGPDAQRVASEQNTAPAPETQQSSLFPEIGPGGTLPGVAPETDLLERIASLRLRPNMSTQGKQALDNYERALSSPLLAHTPTRPEILDAIRDQLDRMANLGEGARQQVDTREGIKQVLADKQKELNAAREEAAALARTPPEKTPAPGTFQGAPTFAAARQKVVQLQQEMAALAQQLAQTTSKETVPVENRAVQPVWVPPANKGLTKAQQANPTPTQEQIEAQTPAKGGTHAPGYTKVGEVGYTNVEPGTQQAVSPVRTAASTATTDTVQGPGGSKMPTVSTSTTVERRDRPNATSVRGKEMANAAEINDLTLDLEPEDQRSFDFWDSVYGVETPVYDLVRQAEGTLVKLESALEDATAKRNQLAMAQAAAERAEEARKDSAAMYTTRDENNVRVARVGETQHPGSESTLPLQDEDNAKAIAEATDKYNAAVESTKNDPAVVAAEAAVAEVEARVSRLRDAEQYRSLVHYIKTDPAAIEAELDKALSTLLTLLSGDAKAAPQEQQARNALASLMGSESLTRADMQAYFKQRPAFEAVLGSHYADMFDTVVRLKAAVDVQARVAKYEKDLAEAKQAVSAAKDAGRARVEAAQAAIPARASKLEVLEQRLAEAQAQEAELGQQAAAARRQLAEARRMRQDVIDSAEAMRAGKKSALEEQQEALRKDIERLSGDLQAVADSIVGIKDVVSQDFRNLLRYPGAMQDLEARFDFVTSVLEGLEAQGVSSPRLETQQAGMVVATQRAERVKHERRVRTLELKRDWWKRVLAAPDSTGKARAEATRGLKETEDALAAENADYRSRTAETPGNLLRDSAGMKNARVAETMIREQRQRLNDAYEQLTERVRQIQQLTVPAGRQEERGALTKTASVPKGTPAAPDTGARPDYADMQRKRGLLVALSAIDLKEQAKLDAAIDAAARATEEARRQYERTPGNAMPASYYDALSNYDKAVKAKRDYMDARAAENGIETRKMQLAREIDALPVQEYQQLVEAEAAGTPVENPSVGLAGVVRQLTTLNRPEMSPRRSSAAEIAADAAEKARAEDPKNRAFQQRVDSINDIGSLKKVQGALENQIADAVAARDKDPGAVVPLPVRSPLSSTIMGKPSDARAKARLKLNEEKVASLQYRLDMVNEKLAALQKVRKEARAAEPKERELQGNAFEVFEAEMAAKEGRRGRGPVVAPEKIAGDMRTGSPESRAGDNKTGTRRRIQESGQVRQPTAKQAMREGNRAAAERARAAAEEAEQARLDKIEEARAAREAAKAKKGRAIPEQKGEQFGADYDEEPVTKKAPAPVATPEPQQTDTGQAVSSDAARAWLEGLRGSKPAVFRTATNTGVGMKAGAVTRLVDRIIEGWKNAPQITVVDSEADLPPRLRAQATADGMEGRVPGLFDPDTKTVYLVADNLHDAKDVALTVAHEVAGHYGLRDMMGAEYETTMARLYAGNSSIRKEADAKMAASPKLSRAVAVEEALADLAERGDPSTLRQIWHAIKAWLAKAFNVRGVTDEEVQQIVTNARKHVQEGRATGAGTGGGAVYRSAYALSDTIAKPRTFKERVGGNLALAAEMHSVDMRAPLREALAKGDKRAAEQAMHYVRKNDQRMGQVYAVFEYGALGIKKDTTGRYTVEAGHSKSVQDVFKAIDKIPGASAAEKMEKAQVYLTAIRAQADPKASFALQLGKVPPAQIAADLAKLTVEPKQKDALEEVRRVYADLNKGMVQFLVDTGAISKDDGARYTSSDSYVPFYRVRPDGVAELVFDETKIMRLGDIRTQPYLKALEGGDSKILPLNEAITRNVMLLTDMGMRNLTTKNVAYALQAIGKPAKKMQITPGPGPANSKALRFQQDGKEYHLIVDTDGTAAEGIPSAMVANSMEGSYTVLPTFLKAFGWAGDVLRAGVTRNPMYVARQLFRDPFAASFTGGLERGPLTAVAKSIASFTRQSMGERSKTSEALLKKGIVQSGIFTGDPDDLAKMSLGLAGNDTGAIRKLFNLMDRAAMRSDSVTREQLYDDVLKRTGSEVLAESAAMEMMNFHKRGLSPTVQYASRLIPFFNAQIQGLNVLYKAATGKATAQEKLDIQNKFWDRAGMLMAATLVYAMAMDDDDTYKNARASDRYGNWFVPLSRGGKPEDNVTLKLPIPFEVGVLFKAIPEAIIDAMKGQFGDAEFKAIRNLVLQQVPGYGSMGLPQAVKPIIELGTNHNFFTGREIESKAQQALDPQERFTARTTELAKRLSEMMPDGMQLSPLQIEHLARGYLGSMPLMAAATMNDVFGSPAAEAPTRKLTETPLVGVAFQDRYGGGAVDILYAKIKAADQAKATYDKMVHEGRKQDAKMYLADIENLRTIPMLQNAEKKLQALAQQEKAVRMSTNTPERKRELLDQVAARREAESRKYLDAVSAVSR